MKLRLGSLAAAAALAFAAHPGAAQDAPHDREARAIYAKLIGFRTAAGHKEVPKMAAYIAETLHAGGVPAADIVTIPHEETAALLVRIPGRDAAARPLLFSGHMDVVDARPEDWERSPFTLVEESGYFYGRGTGDNKAGIAAMVSTILRMRKNGHRPRRTLVFGFVGDEETTFGTTRLIAAHDWVRNAEYAINTDAGGGGLSEAGKPLLYTVQGAEKTYATFLLSARNPGGHSSIPRSDNAIYDLARALLKVEAHKFPVMANSLTRAYFGTVGKAVPGAEGNALRRFAANPDDREATALLLKNPGHARNLATTCVATMIEAGHAENALPQRAEAKVNCRIFPGVKVEAVRQALVAAIADPTLKLEVTGDPEESLVSEPRADVTAAITRSIQASWPGVPIVPYLESGGSDGLVYRSAGIPTWGSSGIFIKDSDVFWHGLNERIPVAGFYQSIDHIHDLAVELGGG